MSEPWWKSAVFYQVYPRSFSDADGDGVGDLAGITARLDHIASLGVDAVWLSPFYPSPMRDNGYDISDHCDVDPTFGDLADFDALLAACHERDLRLIVDFVPNHVSSDHPWFVEAVEDPTSPTRDWFIWADPGPDGGPPNNWRASFTGGSAWELDEASGQYYLHFFLPSQPDLDWTNDGAAEAQLDVLRFWLDKGVDGFRVDVLNAVGKDPELADVPEALAGLDIVMQNHHPTAMPPVRRMRSVIDDAGDHVMVGEIATVSVETQAGYQGDGDGAHLCVNFPSIFAPWERDAWSRLVTEMEQEFPHDGPRWPSYVLSNHDFPRLRTRYGDRESRVRAALVLLLTLRGTPFLYQGDELGLSDAVILEGTEIDPGGRDGCRAPIPWTSAPLHGWNAKHWLPFPPLSSVRNVEWQDNDPLSVLRLVRRVIAVRRARPALQLGALELLDGPDEVLVFRRWADDDECLVAVSFADRVVEVPIEGTVLIASDGVNVDGVFAGSLNREQAVVIAPGA